MLICGKSLKSAVKHLIFCQNLMLLRPSFYARYKFFLKNLHITVALLTPVKISKLYDLPLKNGLYPPVLTCSRQILCHNIAIAERPRFSNNPISTLTDKTYLFTKNYKKLINPFQKLLYICSSLIGGNTFHVPPPIIVFSYL